MVFMRFLRDDPLSMKLPEGDFKPGDKIKTGVTIGEAVFLRKQG